MAVATAVWVGSHRKVGPSRLRSHLGYLITTVVSLHVAGLLMLISSPVVPVPTAGRSAMQFRVVPPRDRVATVESAGLDHDSLASAGELNDATQVDALTHELPVEHAERAAARFEAAGGPADGAVPVGPEAAEILARAEVPPTVDDDAMLSDLRDQAQLVKPGFATDGANEYLPRRLLTVAPQTAVPVFIDFPLQSDQIGHFATVLALFIDEAGVVRRIRVDGTALPAPFEDAARRGFMNARFRPGQLHGQLVKSLIHVEVVFDNTAMDVDRGVKSLSFSL